MSRCFTVVLTVFLMLLMVFPMQTVYAADPQGDELVHTADGLPGEENEADGDILIENESSEQEQNSYEDEQLEHEETENPIPDETDSDLSTPTEIGEPDSKLDEEVQSEEIQFINRVLFDDSNLLLFLHTGESAESLSVRTEGYAMYSRFEGVYCEIVWRYDALDTETPGRKVLIGDPVLPEGYVFEEEPLTVKCVIIVYDDSGASFAKVTDCFTGVPRVLPQGASEEEVLAIFEEEDSWKDYSALLTTEDGNCFSVPFTLDLSVIDTGTPGAYYPVKLELPGGATFAGREFWMNTVHVVPTDEVDLRAIRLADSTYEVRWLYQESNPVLWVSVDDEDWQMQIEEAGHHPYGRFFDPDFPSPRGFWVAHSGLEAGHVYRFQVDYDGDRHSNVLILDFTESDIPKAANGPGGDRNGGDREENKPPEGLGEENGNNGNDGDNGGSGGSTTGSSKPSGSSKPASKPDKLADSGTPEPEKPADGSTPTPEPSQPNGYGISSPELNPSTESGAAEPNQEEAAALPQSIIGPAQPNAAAPTDKANQTSELSLTQEETYLLAEQNDEGLTEPFPTAEKTTAPLTQSGDQSLDANNSSDGSWTPLLLTGMAGLVAAGAFFGLTRKRWWK